LFELGTVPLSSSLFAESAIFLTFVDNNDLFVATFNVDTYICAMKIEDAIKQLKPFKTEYQKVVVNVLYTASWLDQHGAKMLRQFDISPQQYNLLRILRGMHPEPGSVKAITERMLDKMSNTSRLVDKLLAKGLVERDICPSDRRMVNVRITAAGLQILKDVQPLMEDQMHELISGISQEEAAMLNKLLDKMRS
jgi:DNA-binding MarR family transcriptional regulator